MTNTADTAIDVRPFNVDLAVTSTGDIPCYSTNVSSRTDTPSARAFLSRFRL